MNTTDPYQGLLATHPRTNPLFDNMFDDAAIFPPGNAPMGTAVDAHRAHRSSSHAYTVGPFICSESRWTELTSVLSSGAEPLSLSLVVSRGPQALRDMVDTAGADPRVDLRSVEIPVDSADPDELVETLRTLSRTLPETVRSYVELPLRADLANALDVAALSSQAVKFRTGGPTATAFPTESELAVAIAAALTTDVAFKLTAGLHHAVRHRDPQTGFEHHGFLNVLVAVAAGLGGADANHLVQILAERDADVLTAAASSADAQAVRRVFRAFGTCSIDDPVGDLRALALLTAGTP